MPLYEYRCSACEHQFEVIQSFSDKPLRKCTECGGKVEKLVSRTGFVLKGGGWYKTDYAGSGSSKKSSKDGGSSSSEGGGAEPAPSEPAAPKPDSGGKAESGSKPKGKGASKG